MSSATFNSPNHKGLLLWKQGLWRNQFWQLTSISLLTPFSFYHHTSWNNFLKYRNFYCYLPARISTAPWGQHRILLNPSTLFSHGVVKYFFQVNLLAFGLFHLCKGSLHLWLETFRTKLNLIWLVCILLDLWTIYIWLVVNIVIYFW